ncbi:hypothetical protein MWU49_09580 [Alcanivorax sp. S6407]|uniref:hypothetical protein n=1 Tax=Alcanivorax sp. S6407 TaxID=2926424 RepID=UPI001FF35590|nr:hypothetical protein [Alcanivorax sp. S6407]MCK0153953.1 hypothetical protein [Alcanivorax sp. S6407]
MIRTLIFFASLSIFTSPSHAAPYDDLPPEIRAKIMKNMAEVESDMKAYSNGKPIHFSGNGDEFSTQTLPDHNDIDWAIYPEPQSKLLGYTTRDDGTSSVGTFGSEKNVSQLDDHYMSKLPKGWKRHVMTDGAIIFVKGGPDKITNDNFKEFYHFLQKSQYVEIRKLQKNALNFNGLYDESHISTVQITSE